MALHDVFQMLAGVGLFLFGIKLLSDALQYLAGDRMRRLVGAVTSTPFRGVLVGALVTMLIQSSSGVTVMTVSLVNTGIMSLSQAIGVIMGANIGTTVTAQIIAFKIKDIALPFIALGAFLCLFGRSDRIKQAGNGFVGFGMLFLGMQFMESSMAFLRDNQSLFLAMSHNPLLGVLAGTVLTVVVQSSSATIGLTIAMASQGLLDLNAALPIILGDNIGTTITAVIAALGTNRPAQQAAAAHVLFNVIGVIIFMLGLPLFKEAVRFLSADIARQLANAHTMFNLVNTLLFLPFTGPFARLVRALLPDRAEATDVRVKYIDAKLLNVSPAAAVNAVRDELGHMGEMANRMAALVRGAYKGEQGQDGEIRALEEGLDELNKAIAKFAGEIWRRKLPQDVSMALRAYVSSAGDLERVGDHLENLMEVLQAKREGDVRFSIAADREFQDMFTSAQQALALALTAISESNAALADKVINGLEKDIDRKEREYRQNHIERVTRQECEPERGVLFVEALVNLERIGDHAHNIACWARDNAGTAPA